MKKISGRGEMCDVIPERLQQGEVFGALSVEAIKFLLRECDLLGVDAGEQVFKRGDSGESFYIVCSGSIGFYRGQRENPVLIRNAGFGEVVGFVAMIALHDHQGDANALEDSVLLKVSSHQFHRLHEAYPSDFGIMMMNLTRHLARVIGRITDSMV